VVYTAIPATGIKYKSVRFAFCINKNNKFSTKCADARESEVRKVSTKEKEALLNEIAQLKPEDKAFVLGYCAHATANAEAED
jgi:hypothetical protein